MYRAGSCDLGAGVGASAILMRVKPPSGWSVVMEGGM
jgi:hypothetical protein